MNVHVSRPSLGSTPCTICAMPDAQRQEVHAAIWDDPTKRNRRYRAAGLAVANLYLDPPLVARDVIRNHADHIEYGWRIATPDAPATGKEKPVFAVDYDSMVDSAASLGAAAMRLLEKRVKAGDMTDRDLLAAAKLGVSSRGQERATEVASKNPKIELTAILNLASGHAAVMPESEVKNVTPETDLLAEVRAERKKLEEFAASV